MSFRSAVIRANNSNATTTNGMNTLKSSLNPVVDLFFAIGASRGKDITPLFQSAYAHDPELTCRVALWARDIRGGQGERQTFRNYLRFLEQTNSEYLKKIMPKISEIGRWDDYFTFLTPEMRRFGYLYVSMGLANPSTMGLAAKWTPRKGPIANEFRKFLGLTPKQFRKMLVEKTNVVETKMCAKEWETINFEHVPSVASARYQKAFNKRAPVQYQEFKNKLVKGEAKVNASAIYPYDVVRNMKGYDRSNDAVNEALWDTLPNYLTEGRTILPICDVSGSMCNPIGPGSSVSCLDVSIGLGLYIASKQEGPFSNIVCTFSAKPEFHVLKGKTLRNRIEEIAALEWGMNTNLNAVFEKLLDIALKQKLKQSDMPEMLLIFSDMEFDRCATFTAHGMITKRYNDAGYNLPKIVFWNLNARMGNVPVESRENGVALVSGFSPSTMTSILACEDFSPESIMMKTIMKPRYDLVE